MHLKTIWALVVITAILTPQASMGQDPFAEDTLTIGASLSSVGAGLAEIPITFLSDEPLAGMEITLTWDSPDVHVDSFSFVGGRVEHLSTLGWSSIGNSISVYVIAFEDLIPTGSGLLGTIHFGYSSSIDPQLVTIDTITIVDSEREYATTFSDQNSQAFVPQFDIGVMDITESGCCINDRGNVDGDPTDAITITDLIDLVEYMFQGGAEPVCMAEANVDGLGEPIPDISDLIHLVNYMFQGGAPPVSCF
jgi:hypothetical protein